MQFKNPIKNGTITKQPTSQKVNIRSFVPNDYVMAPYDGEITDVSSKCGGYVKITHEYNKQEIHSNFCKIKPTQNATTGVNANAGQVIGNIDGDDILFWVENDRGEKISIYSLMSPKVSGDKDKEEKNDKKNDKKGDKKDSAKTSYKNTDSSYSRQKISNPLADKTMKFLLSPFGAVSNVFDTEKRKQEKEERKRKREEEKKKKEMEKEEERKKKEEDLKKKEEELMKENKEKLTEEINRIRELLK